MGYEIPTLDDVKGLKTGGIDGTALAVGETVGRSALGSGLGTAMGGAAVAAANSGERRDRMATVAFERGMMELLAGGGSNSGGSRGTM